MCIRDSRHAVCYQNTAGALCAADWRGPNRQYAASDKLVVDCLLYTSIAEEIFNEILRQCMAKGLVGGGILYTDSTHIKAKANKHKKKLVEVAVTPKAYPVSYTHLDVYKRQRAHRLKEEGS